VRVTTFKYIQINNQLIKYIAFYIEVIPKQIPDKIPQILPADHINHIADEAPS